MQILEVVGICVGALLLVLFAIFFRRRVLNLGGGTIRLQVRISTLFPGRGWSHGHGQFVGDKLKFYRLFSLAFRPKRVLDRGALAVREKRAPEGPERLSIPGHWCVLRCAEPAGEIEIAMAESTVTGFLSWLESAPPGQRQPGLTPHPVIRPRTLDL